MFVCKQNKFVETFEMFSDSEEDDEDSSGFFYWNNWSIPNKRRSRTEETEFNVKFANPVACKTWLAPRGFGSRRKPKEPSCDETICSSGQVSSDASIHPSDDWGQRMVLSSSFGDIEENDMTWNYFHAGVFGNFKIERNAYGHIVAFADAEVGDAEEKAYIEINKEQHLRNLLGVSLDDWNALIEALGSSRFCLRYEALKKPPVKMSIEEKLWYYLCKRRHYLPILALRLRRNGAKKMAQCFNIFPKFRVEQIRTFDGIDLA